MIGRIFIGVVIVVAVEFGMAQPAQAVFLSGPDARAAFDDLVANYGATLIDFESFAAGTNLTSQVSGLSFESVISPYDAALIPPEHVEVSNAYFGTYGRTIVGSYAPAAADDGRVVYQIVFATPQRAAGILRIWGNTLTTFYTESGTAIYTGEGSGYHGVMIESDDTADWVKRIYCDGLVPSQYNRQVGYSDDLIYGDAIPEPAALTLGLFGAALILCRRR